MKEPTPANTAIPDDFENLRKRIDDLHTENVFLRLPRVVISIAIGVALGSFAYWASSNLSSAILGGFAVSIASLALDETERLRKHTAAVLAVLDNETADSRPEDTR